MANPGKNKKQHSVNQTVQAQPKPENKQEEKLGQALINMGIGVISVIVMALIVIAMMQFVA